MISVPIDFVLSFSQSEVDVGVFMELPLVTVVDGSRGEYVLKLNKSIY